MNRTPRLTAVTDATSLATTDAPTRQAVLLLHAKEFRSRRGVSLENWAERVDREYCRRVPEQHRTISAPDLSGITNADVYRKRLRAWDQVIRRFDEGEVRFPSELEEAWIFALEDPYRSACIRELSHRVGCYGAQIRPDGAVGDHSAWGDALESFGSVTVLMGQILADGVIDDRDIEQIADLVPTIDRMQAALETVRRRSQKALAGDASA